MTPDGIQKARGGRRAGGGGGAAGWGGLGAAGSARPAPPELQGSEQRGPLIARRPARASGARVRVGSPHPECLQCRPGPRPWPAGLLPLQMRPCAFRAHSLPTAPRVRGGPRYTVPQEPPSSLTKPRVPLLARRSGPHPAQPATPEPQPPSTAGVPLRPSLLALMACSSANGIIGLDPRPPSLT